MAMGSFVKNHIQGQLKFKKGKRGCFLNRIAGLGELIWCCWESLRSSLWSIRGNATSCSWATVINSLTGLLSLKNTLNPQNSHPGSSQSSLSVFKAILEGIHAWYYKPIELPLPSEVIVPWKMFLPFSSTSTSFKYLASTYPSAYWWLSPSSLNKEPSSSKPQLIKMQGTSDHEGPEPPFDTLALQLLSGNITQDIADRL